MPAVIVAAGDHATRRFLEFFAATIRNKNTRMAYYRAVTEFFAWVERHKSASSSISSRSTSPDTTAGVARAGHQPLVEVLMPPLAAPVVIRARGTEPIMNQHSAIRGDHRARAHIGPTIAAHAVFRHQLCEAPICIVFHRHGHG
jgi:hypothetical protein